MKPVFLGDWADDGYFGMVMDFADVYMTKAEYLAQAAPYPNVEHWREYKARAKAALDDPQYDVDVILASYETGNYEGSAFVLFRRDGKLYEVNASHCSCYGLEGQWSPEETIIPALRKRLNDGHLGRDYDGRNEFAAELSAQLDELEKESAP